MRKLGEGGMGLVHLAEDPDGRRVAVKTMRPELAAREEFRRRFGKEAEAARRVARFCTAPVLDARGTLQAAGSTLSVQIDSLARQGGTVRLQWTVKNVGTENAPLAGKLGGGALDSTVSRVNLIPPGVGRPIHPAWKDKTCACTDLPMAPFPAGARLRMYAIFEGVPQDADRVDVDLVLLGVIRNVAVSSS